MVSANFKLTALPGAVFKLLEFDVLSGFAELAGASIDLETGILKMTQVIISDNGATVSFPNIQLKLDSTSLPIKFGL